MQCTVCSVSYPNKHFCPIYQGSGKTLAFGIPILTHILVQKAAQETVLEMKSNEDDDTAESCIPETDTGIVSDEVKKPLLALIMTPTRELALQIRNHIQQAAKHTPIQVHIVVYDFFL